MFGVTSSFDNFAKCLDLESCGDLEMKENMVRYVDNHRFPACKNAQIMDLNLSVDCCDYFCMNDTLAFCNVLREYPHVGIVNPPHFLASWDYT